MHVRQRKCFVKIRHGKEKIGSALEKLCDAAKEHSVAMESFSQA